MARYPQKKIHKMHDELIELQDRFGSLQEFYGIPDKRLQIQFVHTSDDTIKFHISFVRSIHTSLLEHKISKYVLLDVESFAKEHINIELLVKYPCDYPFNPPVWSLNKYRDNIVNEDMSKYYEHIIQSHNEVYSVRRQWCPIITLRTDFLDLLMKLTMGVEYTISVDQKYCETV